MKSKKISKALACSPVRLPPHVVMGLFVFATLSGALISEGCLARPSYAEPVNRHPLNKNDSLLDRAELMTNSGKVEEAQVMLERYLKMQPRSAKAWFLLGAVKQDMAALDGKVKVARQCYLKALSFNSNYSNAYRKLGELAGMEGNWKEEIHCCDLALACKEPDQRAFKARAIAKSNLHLDKEALADYEKFRLTRPDLATTPRVMDEYVTFLENAGKYEPAIATLLALEKTDSRHSIPFRRAKLYGRAGRPVEAIALLNKLIAAQPDDEMLYAERARLFIKTGKLQDALKDWNEVIKLEPSSQYFTERASLLESMGYTKRAEEDRQKALARE